MRRMAGRTDIQMALCSITQGCNGHVKLSTPHTHTHWIVGRQKRRALDSFERIKEAEKLVEMHWVDLQNRKELNKRCEHTDSVASGFIAVEGLFFFVNEICLFT